MKTRDVVVLFSGGWDSVFCAVHAIEHYGHDRVRLLFFDYGQPYLEQETAAADYAARTMRLPMERVTMPQLEGVSGVFDDRNGKLLRETLRLGDVSIIYFGCRCPLPVFDKFGDSNMVWGMKQAHNLGFSIEMPCVLLPKRYIGWRLRRAGLELAKLYSTDPAANQEHR